MEETIKLFDGVNVTVDGETAFTESPQEMFLWLNMTDDKKYHEMRIAIIRELLIFHRVDLSEFSNGHTVVLEIVPTKEDADDEENMVEQ